MPYVIGIVLCAWCRSVCKARGFDRDRAFYPTVMIVIASYYVLFAAMSGVGSHGAYRVGADGCLRGCGRCRVQVECVDRRGCAGWPWRL